jgi:hypothetical protein
MFKFWPTLELKHAIILVLMFLLYMICVYRRLLFDGIYQRYSTPQRWQLQRIEKENWPRFCLGRGGLGGYHTMPQWTCDTGEGGQLVWCWMVKEREGPCFHTDGIWPTKSKVGQCQQKMCCCHKEHDWAYHNGFNTRVWHCHIVKGSKQCLEGGE